MKMLYMTLYCKTLHYMTLNFMTLHFMTLHFMKLHIMTLHFAAFDLTPGQVFLSSWGSLPLSANSALICLLAAQGDIHRKEYTR